MKATVTLDDDLVRFAQELSGVHDISALVREALNALIQKESSLRLAVMGALYLGSNLPPGASKISL